jgi:hypothetical protein
MADQVLLRSQFITTCGPGAILEGRTGPRIIHVLGKSNMFTKDRPTGSLLTRESEPDFGCIH